jgi:hypothetical protein
LNPSVVSMSSMAFAVVGSSSINRTRMGDPLVAPVLRAGNSPEREVHRH